MPHGAGAYTPCTATSDGRVSGSPDKGDHEASPLDSPGDERSPRLRRSARLAPSRRGARPARPQAEPRPSSSAWASRSRLCDRCRGARRRSRRGLARRDVPRLLPLRRAPDGPAVRRRVAAAARAALGPPAGLVYAGLAVGVALAMPVSPGIHVIHSRALANSSRRLRSKTNERMQPVCINQHTLKMSWFACASFQPRWRKRF